MSPRRGPHPAPLRQRIESICWTAKDILALAAPVSLNYELERPSRVLVDYVA